MYEINVCHLQKMQASQESIKDAPMCSAHGSTVGYPKKILVTSMDYEHVC